MKIEVVVNLEPPPEGQELHRLLSQAYASMEGRIDPPSSMMRLSPTDIMIKLATEDLIVARSGDRILGCLFGHAEDDAYYVGKIAVARPVRRQGLARTMIEAAAKRGAALGKSELRLQSRVELIDNHAAFLALGFDQSGTYSHPGFDRPTSLVFTRPLSPSPALS